MSPRPDMHKGYRVVPGDDLTIDVYGADGTRLRVRGRFDKAHEVSSGGRTTRLEIRDAVARVLTDEEA